MSFENNYSALAVGRTTKFSSKVTGEALVRECHEKTFKGFELQHGS